MDRWKGEGAGLVSKITTGVKVGLTENIGYIGYILDILDILKCLVLLFGNNVAQMCKF